MALQQLFVSPWFWVIAGTLLMGLEILVPGVFVLWIGLGALVVGIFLVLFPDATLAWQLVLFASAMLASIGTGFVIQRRGRNRPDAADALNQERNAMRGHSYPAIDDFSGGHGRVRVGDGSYAALSDDAIRAGDIVTVTAIADGRLVVKKV